MSKNMIDSSNEGAWTPEGLNKTQVKGKKGIMNCHSITQPLQEQFSSE